MFHSINPYTQQILATFKPATAKEVKQIVHTSNVTQLKWKQLAINSRAQKVLQLGKLIEKNHEDLAKLATLEMGKTLNEAKLEVLKCITACTYYAQQAASLIKPISTVHTDGRTVQILFEPMGVILGIFPWNFPYWQIIRSAIPIIMAGNTMLVKPAPNTIQCAQALQKLVNDAGLGDGIIETLLLTDTQVAELIEDKRIKACTLTGSEKAGATVASLAANQIKKSVLELGGSDPFIVLDDADLSLVMSNAVSARFQNNGQSCIASKRYIVHEKIATTFTTKLITATNALVQGNPLDPTTQIGPLARIDLKEKLAQQVAESVKKGAKIAYQAKLNLDSPCFFPPTILHHIPKNTPAYSEELFGPVIALFVVKNDEEAISLANDTEFGLGASVWSANKKRAATVASKLEAGQVFINAVTRSNAAFPFGGIKKSGYGREMGEYGLKEFCYVKSIWV